MNQKEIINYCDRFLKIDEFQDYCPNGLQVEGDGREVKKISLAVSATLELLEKSAQRQVDLIIVHHGLFWNKDNRAVKGPLRNRLKLLLESGVALAAYHLPLDFHPEVGNNARLARMLGLKNQEGFSPVGKYFRGVIGEPEDADIHEFSLAVEKATLRAPMLLHHGESSVKRAAIMTGAAQGSLPEAVEAGADCFITGEVSENIWGLSREHKINFIGAGHYATEKFGVQALGDHLAEKLGVEAEFLDLFNPI